jgi:hypothetical protein
MSEFQMQEGKQHPSDRDPQMDEQLLRLEQELLRFVPASPTTNPDAMMSYVWSVTRQDASPSVIENREASDAVDSRVVLAKAMDRKRFHWVGAIAGSWLAGMIAGALAMWAVTTSGTGGPRVANQSGSTEPSRARHSQTEVVLVQPNAIHITSTDKASHLGADRSIGRGPNASSQRNFDVEDVMANTQLTVFTAKHIKRPDDPWSDHDVGNLQASQVGASEEPSTRNNLMKSLVF